MLLSRLFEELISHLWLEVGDLDWIWPSSCWSEMKLQWLRTLHLYLEPICHHNPDNQRHTYACYLKKKALWQRDWSLAKKWFFFFFLTETARVLLSRHPSIQGYKTQDKLEELHLPHCSGHLQIPQEEQEDVAGEKDIWAVQLTLLLWRHWLRYEAKKK